MALITFMSDFGESDHYIAAVKARILGINPGLQIIDITHHIDAHNIAHGAYVLRSVFRDFAKGTIHLAAVDTAGIMACRFLALKLEDHFFVVPDNGIFSLVSSKEPALIVEITYPAEASSTFPAREILAKTAALLASGKSLEDVGTYTTEYRRLLDRQVRATKKQITGNVIRVDHYGNLVTNIELETFRHLRNNRPFVVNFARESVDIIHKNYGEVANGDCFVLFNSMGLLEIGIYRGNAAELLGLGYDSPVNINFGQDEGSGKIV